MPGMISAMDEFFNIIRYSSSMSFVYFLLIRHPSFLFIRVFLMAVLDHIIIGDDRYYSFADDGTL